MLTTVFPQVRSDSFRTWGRDLGASSLLREHSQENLLQEWGKQAKDGEEAHKEKRILWGALRLAQLEAKELGFTLHISQVIGHRLLGRGADMSS